jgi:hypothetical protein
MTPSAVAAGGVRKGALTRDQIIEKILRWNALYGEPPCTADWNPSLARWRAQEWRIERYRLGDPESGARWPSVNAAKRLFDGSFDAAVRAAGLVPHRPGPRRRPARSVLPAVEQRAPRAPREVDAELTAAAERVLEAERRAQRAEERVQRAVARAERAEGKVAEVRERARGVERRASERVRAAERHAERVRIAPVREAERRTRTAERAEVARADAQARAVEAERALAAVEARALEAERRAAAAEARVAEVAVAAPAPAPAGVVSEVPDARVRAAEARARAAEARARAAERAGARAAIAERDAAVERAEAAEARLRELEASTNGGRPLGAGVSAELREGSGPVGPGPLAEALKGLARARATNDSVRLHRALTEVAGAAVRWRERL